MRAELNVTWMRMDERRSNEAGRGQNGILVMRHRDALLALAGEAGMESAVQRAGGCERPVRLRGQMAMLDTRTGDVVSGHGSAAELDGFTYVKCRNRRASVCATCSHEYKGDAWHLLVCGLAGGKGVPEGVADSPCTAPNDGAVSVANVHG